MHKSYLLLLLFIVSLRATAQSGENRKLGSSSLQLQLGVIFSGTGDSYGVNISSEWSKRINRKLSYAVGLGTMINDGSFPLNYEYNGTAYDGSIRYTTAAVQLTGKLGYSLFESKTHHFGLQLGPLLRFQSSSLYDQFTFYFPAATNFPIPLVQILNTSPQRTLALGGIFQVFYYRNLSQRTFAGVTPGLQTDSNGDTITQLSVLFGIRL